MDERPAIMMLAFAKACKISPKNLDLIRYHGQEPRESTWNKMLPVMRRYGYKKHKGKI